MQVSGKGSGRVSRAALLALRPGLRTGLCYTTRTHHGRRGERKSLSEHDYIALIDGVHQQLRAPMTLVWDRLNTHISAVMRALIAARPWLRVYLLPSYAPDLNPVEAVWSQIKRSLANLGTGSLQHLVALIRNRLKSLQYHAHILSGFLAETGLNPKPP